MQHHSNKLSSHDCFCPSFSNVKLNTPLHKTRTAIFIDTPAGNGQDVDHLTQNLTLNASMLVVNVLRAQHGRIKQR